MTAVTFADFSKDPKAASLALEKGAAFKTSIGEMKKVYRSVHSLYLSEGVLKQMKKLAKDLAGGKRFVRLDAGALRELGESVDSDDGGVQAMDGGVSAGLVILAVAAAVVVAGGIFVAGVAIGFAAGDFGEEDNASVTIKTEDEEVTVEFGDD